MTNDAKAKIQQQNQKSSWLTNIKVNNY